MHGRLDAVNRHAAAVCTRVNPSKSRVMSALIPSEQRQVALFDGGLETNSNKSARRSSQTARAPRGSGAGLLLPFPHSLTCNPVFGRSLKDCCVQRAGAIWQRCARFCSTVARHGLYEMPTKGVRGLWQCVHIVYRDCVPSVICALFEIWPDFASWKESVIPSSLMHLCYRNNSNWNNSTYREIFWKGGQLNWLSLFFYFCLTDILTLTIAREFSSDTESLTVNINP